jgi:hypothetical protein
VLFVSEDVSLFVITLWGVVGGESVDEPRWRRARRCDSGACVEIGILGDLVLIRGTADPDDRRVTLSHEGWREFVTRVKTGDFDGLRPLGRRPFS